MHTKDILSLCQKRKKATYVRVERILGTLISKQNKIEQGVIFLYLSLLIENCHSYSQQGDLGSFTVTML